MVSVSTRPEDRQFRMLSWLHRVVGYEIEIQRGLGRKEIGDGLLRSIIGQKIVEMERAFDVKLDGFSRRRLMLLERRNWMWMLPGR
jgi:hypothetical protein